jgi:mono/diheme cytochrome c family protein
MAAALVASAVGLSSAPAFAAEDATESKESTAAPGPVAEPEKARIDVRKLFAMNCSWCHDGYGLHAGKGPKLVGTKLNEKQLYERIAKGKSGYMPGFEKTLKKEQIDAFVEYIKGLKETDS